MMLVTDVQSVVEEEPQHVEYPPVEPHLAEEDEVSPHAPPQCPDTSQCQYMKRRATPQEGMRIHPMTLMEMKHTRHNLMQGQGRSLIIQCRVSRCLDGFVT